MRRLLFIPLIFVLWLSSLAADLKLPLQKNSVRFAVIGDTGTGDKYAFETAHGLVKSRELFPFEFVVMLGDNMYGGQRPGDFVRKFEEPYKHLLDAKVAFYAALGNHDETNQRFYKPFNMSGERYYTFKKGNARFFALDSNYMDPKQTSWLENELKNSGSEWKICFFHHPLYSSGGRHGSEVDLRIIIEPLFLKHGVQIVLSGHDHFYERIKPQKGVHYWVVGASAKLAKGDIKRRGLTEVGFDEDRSFMLVEIAGDQLYFQTISRAGQTVDSGAISRKAEKSKN